MAMFDNAIIPPNQNSDAAKRLKAARDLQIQQAVGAVPAAAPGAQAPLGTQAAQQLGAQAVQQTGKSATALTAQQGGEALASGNLALNAAIAQKQNDQASQQLGQETEAARAQVGQQAALTREGRDAQQQLTQKEIQSNDRLSHFGIETDNNLSFLNRVQREQLAALGSDIKQQIFDGRLQFAKDEQGRKFTNERQLADFALSSTQNAHELANKLQSMQQAADRDVKLAQAAHNRIVEALKQGSLDRQRELTQQQREELARMKIEADKAIRKRKAKAANTGAIITGVATIAGAVGGGILAGPAGAAVGAQAGGAAGGIISSQAT